MGRTDSLIKGRRLARLHAWMLQDGYTDREAVRALAAREGLNVAEVVLMIAQGRRSQ